MGNGRRVGEVGPDEAGNILSLTTVKVSFLMITHDSFRRRAASSRD